VDVGGYRLRVHGAGRGLPTVGFESGGGDTSSVWTPVALEVRERKSVRTLVYDRAGLGRSDPKPGPYAIDDEVAALRTLLAACVPEGPLVLVAHSYGGFVSLLTATSDPRVVGLVLVDANIPEFFDDAQVARLLERFRARVAALSAAHPTTAKTMVPLTFALPETARRVRATSLSTSLPVIDIVAERTWVESPEEVAAARAAHAAFVAASPARVTVFATGSGHYVMHDRPELVVDAISRMVDRVRAW
jgi:pimeloyl-ACP methyl ester carboxylesterase